MGKIGKSSFARKFKAAFTKDNIKRYFKDRLGTIIVFAIALIFVVWGIISVQIAKANANPVNYKDYVPREATQDPKEVAKLEYDYKLVASDDKLELYFDYTHATIQLVDKETNYTWKGSVDEEVFPNFRRSNDLWKNKMTSSILITYNDMKARDGLSTEISSAGACDYLEVTEIENGVSVLYGFTTYGIYVTVEYVLDGDELVVRVPYDKIKEETKFALTTVEVLPFFGAAANDKTGYLFYPDGSGAITSFENYGSRPSNVKPAFYYTFTNKDVNFKNMWDEELYNRYTAAMPVYGIKEGDNALFATATSGAENVGIYVAPSGVVVDLNRSCFQLYTRNVYTVNMYNMSTGSGVAATGALVQRVDKLLIEEDKEIRYYFLNGEDADYSGMAQVYREYLIENGLLNDAIQDGEPLPLALNLLLGTTKEGMVFDEYVSMTNFAQVEEILGRLTANGVVDAEVVLQAWMKDYDNYEYWGPANQLGGTKGLTDLNGYLGTSSFEDVYLEVGMMFANSNTNKLNEDEDVAYDGMDIEISFEDMDGVVQYMMNPQAAFERNQDFLDNVHKYNRLNVAYEDVGLYAFADNNEYHRFTKAQSVDKLSELLASTKAANKKLASKGSNQYVYAYADYMYGLREEAFGLSITDYSVPFIQMVFSGMIPYSTEGAGNLSYDLRTQILTWVEYGALPYFYLTYESALNLRDTDYDTLFSSTYADWEETVVTTYNEFKERLSCVYGAQMIDHKNLTGDLVRVEYDNGIAIYINYANTESTVDGVKIPAKDYVVVQGGEQ